MSPSQCMQSNLPMQIECACHKHAHKHTCAHAHIHIRTHSHANAHVQTNNTGGMLPLTTSPFPALLPPFSLPRGPAYWRVLRLVTVGGRLGERNAAIPPHKWTSLHVHVFCLFMPLNNFCCWFMPLTKKLRAFYHPRNLRAAPQ